MEKTINNEEIITLGREETIKQAIEIRQKIKDYHTQLYNLLKSSNLKCNTLNFNFFLSNNAGTRIRTVYCQNKKFIYCTDTLYCNMPCSIKDIFISVKPYFDKYVKEYENYKIQRKPITNSTFRIIIVYNINTADLDNKKRLYEIDIDNLNKNKITYEFKNNFLIEENNIKVTSFYIMIEVELYNHNKFFQYDGEKDPIIEDVCILCNKNKPNVLITKCFHLVVCCDCNRFKNLNNCPRCNKPIAAIHKVTFAVSKK